MSAAHIAALGQISKEAKTLCLFALVGWGIEKRAGAASSQQPAGLQQAQRAHRAQPAQPAQRAQQRPATLGPLTTTAPPFIRHPLRAQCRRAWCPSLWLTSS